MILSSKKSVMLWILGPILILFLISVIAGWIVSAPVYRGEVSDHFDGKVFLNEGGIRAKGLSDVLKWVRSRKREPWQESQGLKAGMPPKTAVSEGIRITFINHSTFLIQTAGYNILTDPIWSQRTSPVQFAGPSRMRPPGIKFEDLPSIDYVLISHNHYDHLDVATMKRLIKAYDPIVISPLGVGGFIEKIGTKKVHDLDWWQNYSIEKDLSISCVQAQHFSGRGMFDRDATLWCGYIIHSGQDNIYFAGDTGYGEFFERIQEQYGAMRVSLIPIGAYLPRWFMSPIHISPKEAVQVHLDVRSELSIAMHFGTFPLADDGKQRPIIDLESALREYDLGQEAFIVPVEGRPIDIVSEK